MEFEQDYIMRLIKQMVAALISVILGKENKTYELPLEDQYKSSEGLLRELLTMVNNGKINEAENLLYEKLEHGNRKDIESAILSRRRRLPPLQVVSMEEICLSGSLQSPTEIKASGGLQGCADEVCQQS